MIKLMTLLGVILTIKWSLQLEYSLLKTVGVIQESAITAFYVFKFVLDGRYLVGIPFQGELLFFFDGYTFQYLRKYYGIRPLQLSNNYLLAPCKPTLSTLQQSKAYQPQQIYQKEQSLTLIQASGDHVNTCLYRFQKSPLYLVDLGIVFIDPINSFYEPTISPDQERLFGWKQNRIYVYDIPKHSSYINVSYTVEVTEGGISKIIISALSNDIAVLIDTKKQVVYRRCIAAQNYSCLQPIQFTYERSTLPFISFNYDESQIIYVINDTIYFRDTATLAQGYEYKLECIIGNSMESFGLQLISLSPNNLYMTFQCGLEVQTMKHKYITIARQSPNSRDWTLHNFTRSEDPDFRVFNYIQSNRDGSKLILNSVVFFEVFSLCKKGEFYVSSQNTCKECSLGCDYCQNSSLCLDCNEEKHFVSDGVRCVCNSSFYILSQSICVCDKSKYLTEVVGVCHCIQARGIRQKDGECGCEQGLYFDKELQKCVQGVLTMYFWMAFIVGMLAVSSLIFCYRKMGICRIRKAFRQEQEEGRRGVRL